MQGLGLNHGGYHGERIDAPAVLRSLVAEAGSHDWRQSEVEVAPGRRLLFLTRPAADGRPGPNLYLSAGIHGDEPAGPLAMLELVRSDGLPRDANIWLCPCLNPTGFMASTRENEDGADLNRDYREPSTPEVRAHVEWLAGLPRLDLTILLHEDWESAGFYLYELNPDGPSGLAESMIAAVRPVCPIDPSPVIDGRETHAPGIIRPPMDPTSRPQWPEAFWLYQHRTRLSYTIEAPSDFALSVRVAALVAAVRGAIGKFTGI